MPTEELKILEQLTDVLDAYKGQNSLIGCQGQGMDGYSALANFVAIAEKAQALLKSGEE